MKRAAIYTRVSTEEQSEKGYSLGVQKAEIIRWADASGFTVVGTFADDISGKTYLPDRPEGAQLQALADAGALDAVIVYRVDRLSRDLINLLVLVRSWLQAGIEIYALDVGQIKSENDIVLVIRGWQGGDEHKKILERTSSGRNAKAQDGQPVMAGHPPYGYRREGRGSEARLYIYEPESAVVRKIYALYAEGISLRSIAQLLQGAAEPTPSNRINAAKFWIPETIRGILGNEIYTGMDYYGKTRIVNKKRIRQPHDLWIPIPVPELQIIPRELYDAAQLRLERNRELSKRNRKYDYLLSGFMRCGACGGIMVGAGRKTRGYFYLEYRCGAHWKKLGRPPCPNENKSIVSTKIEDRVWSWVVSLMENPESLAEGLRDMENRRQDELAPKQKRLTLVNRMTQEVEQKMRRLIERLGDEEDAEIAAILKATLKELAQRKEGLSQESHSLEQEITRTKLTPKQTDFVIAQSAAIRRKLGAAPYTQRRQLMDLLDLKVVFYADEQGRRLKVSCGLKLEGDVIEISPLLATGHNYNYTVVFSAILPLDDGQANPLVAEVCVA